METYLNIEGAECVTIQNDDGTIWSGLKSAYDEMQAQQAAQATLASELSNPSTPQAGE